MHGIKTKADIIKKMIYLRQRGYTITEICKTVNKSKSLVYSYSKNITIASRYHALWKEKGSGKGSVSRSLAQWKDARLYIQNHFQEISSIEKILVGACLYWGEGSKKDLSLSNTDPFLIKVFVAALKELGVSKERLRITIRIYQDINREKAKKYWAKIIGIHQSQILNVNVLYGRKKGKLKYGMCRIRVTRGGFIFKILYSIIEFIKLKIAPVV